ncbi:MAG: type I addiction module toxin, SymE family [Bacteroidales bacterium]|nr:type I addiction module toxin, SymE family [Bacteroidales bacterium]
MISAIEYFVLGSSPYFITPPIWLKNTPVAFPDAKNSENLNKVLKIINAPSGKKYTNGLNIKGEWMNKFGFELGDMVNVEVSQNRILVEKIVGE